MKKKQTFNLTNGGTGEGASERFRFISFIPFLGKIS